MKDFNLLEAIRKADAGDLDAMFEVASYLVYGDQNEELEPEIAERAINYYQICAANGDTYAMLDLGGMYIEGRGVEKDREKALEWYQKAVELGEPIAYRCLGNFYRYDNLEDGKVVLTKDIDRIKKAHEYFVAGSELDNENCLYELGDMFMEGLIENKDTSKAFELYERAYDIILEQKDYNPGYINDCESDVTYRLAKCYHYGHGIDKDIKEAWEYIKTAFKEVKRRSEEGDMFGASFFEEIENEYILIFREIEEGN